MQRSSIVLSGEGVTLRHQETTADLAPFVPVAYDGDQQWSANRKGGTVTAFNVMVRKDRYQATMQLLVESTTVPPGSSAMIVALAGVCAYAIDETTVAGVVRFGFWIAVSDAAHPLRVAPDGIDPKPDRRTIAILVRIEQIGYDQQVT